MYSSIKPNFCIEEMTKLKCSTVQSSSRVLDLQQNIAIFSATIANVPEQLHTLNMIHAVHFLHAEQLCMDQFIKYRVNKNI